MRPVFKLHFLVIILLFVLSKESFSQSGYIIRPCDNTTGKTILDPNGDNYSSKTTSGFLTSDIFYSEVPYKALKAFIREPYGDLRRGPDHLYSDFVPDPYSNGCYVHLDSTATRKNLMFRMRMGTIIPGSKGFSVLIDVDGKFGSTGANADPNYQAATTGINGNPGFEIELVLTTQTSSQAGLEIYNVDGTSNPTLVKSYLNYMAYSQVSISRTSDNGDPDFFLDWYVPFSDLQLAYPSLTTSTPLRMITTTVMAPKPAIGGPKSDIYGLGDASYPVANDQYETFIKHQQSISATNLKDSTYTVVGTLCTASPTIVSATTGTGTGSVTGSWTKDLSDAAGTATITVYKNGDSIGIVSNINSGNSWTLSNVTLASGDVITARAQGTGESKTCFVSNSVLATACTTLPAQPTGVCAEVKGFTGTNLPAGATVNIYRLVYTASGVERTLIRSAVPVTTNLGPGQQGGIMAISGSGWTYDGGCTQGGGSNVGGTYMIYFTVNGCASKPVFVCISNNTGGYSTIATPAGSLSINNSSAIYASATQISGVATASTVVRVYVDGVYSGRAALTGTSWTYTFPSSLSIGQVITVNQQMTDVTAGTGKTYYCVSADVSATVTCKTASPIITADASKKITIGSRISGISGEALNTKIYVYSSATFGSGYTVLDSAYVTSSGNWSTISATAAANIYYYAMAKNGTCAASASSDTVSALPATSSARCGSITTAGITSATTHISGALSGTALAGTKVILYLDDYAIDSTTTSTSAWGPINVTGKLYSNGTLKIGIQEPSSTEVICPGSTVSINCSTYPAQPNVTPENALVVPGGTQTYTVLNPQANVFYGLSDSATGNSMGLGKWAIPVTYPFELTTNAISAPSIVYIKATSVSATEVCSIRSATRKISIIGNATLPVTLVTFNGKWSNDDVVLDWLTAHENNSSQFDIERSADGNSYEKIGKMAVRGNMTGASYSFTDQHPLEVNYYRLRTIEADGKYSYSKVIRIVQKLSAVVLSSVQPNPFAGDFSISLTAPEQQTVKMMLLDASGRIVLQKETSVNRGLNIIKFNNLEQYGNGLYILRVLTDSGLLQQKLMKQGSK